LDFNLDAADASKEEEIKSCHTIIKKLFEQIKEAQNNPVILELCRRITLLKSDSCYIGLIKSDLDIFDLSKHVTLCQCGDTCSVNAIFNCLRTLSPKELAKIQSKSSKIALPVLTKLVRSKGNPEALQKAVNGVQEDCLWGMFLKKSGLEITLCPEFAPFFKSKTQSNNEIVCSATCEDLCAFATEFGLDLNSHPIEYTISTDIEEWEFCKILGKIEKAINAIPCGNYIVHIPRHFIFLKKTCDETRLYDSGIGISGEFFGFSYGNGFASGHLVGMILPGQKIVFYQVTI
jgi:hypothetical protein